MTDIAQQHQGRSLQQVIGTPDIIGKILNYQLYLERKGRKPLTVNQAVRRLTMYVEKGIDLLDPEQVKDFLARQKLWGNRTKIIEVTIYDGFLKFLKIPWEKPEYKPERKPTFIPNEEELDQLIAGSGRKMVIFLKLLKETAMRFGECHQLQWTDINFQRKQISIQTEKGSDPRVIPISQALIEMLSNMPRKSERLFPATRGAITSNYYMQRKKIARKLGNPRIMKISLHTFRHWRITKYAHEVGGNYALVQEFSGHRDIESVAVYIHLRKQIYLNGREDEYIVEIARTVEEASKLISVGYEFVHEYNGVMIYRKRK
jgi:integrase